MEVELGLIEFGWGDMLLSFWVWFSWKFGPVAVQLLLMMMIILKTDSVIY